MTAETLASAEGCTKLNGSYTFIAGSGCMNAPAVSHRRPPPEDTMKTSLITGKEISELDASLIRALNSPLDPQHVWNESLLIGIRNEHNEIYRVIGVTGMSRFIEVMRKLQALGYTEEDPNVYEEEQGFDAILAPHSTSGADRPRANP
jgi:hypothetical protein